MLDVMQIEKKIWVRHIWVEESSPAAWQFCKWKKEVINERLKGSKGWSLREEKSRIKGLIFVLDKICVILSNELEEGKNKKNLSLNMVRWLIVQHVTEFAIESETNTLLNICCDLTVTF